MTLSRRYPQGVPRSINYPEIPLHAFLENSARKFPERDALIFLGNRISYRRLWEETRRFAAALKSLGVGKGERVGLLLPNVPQFVIAYYATLYIGGVVVAVNPLNQRSESERELGETDARVLVILDRFLNKIQDEGHRTLVVAEAEAYLPKTLRLLSLLRRGQARLPVSSLRFEGLLRAKPLDKGETMDPMEDLAIIQYTGGTTGSPKGVMLTHHNLVANTLQAFHWLRGWGYGAKPQPAGHPVVVCAVPFFHIYGMTVALNESVQFGSTLVLIPDPKPEAIMKTIQRYEVTHFPAIPPMISGIIGHPRRSRYDLTSLTSCVSGGAPIDPSLIKRFIEITGAQFYSGYGLTEAGPVTHCTALDGDPRPRSVGLPFPDTEAKVVDLQLGESELPRGQEGELIVRGPQVMKGYWRDPDSTSKVLRGGWLYTGDIARLDEDGYLYILDRKQDRIISSGHTVWPSQIEELLMAHPMVETAAVLGVPDPLRCATDLCAVVAVRTEWDRNEAERELLGLCRERLEPHQVPTRIVFAESLPRTPLGKVDRRALQVELDRLIQANPTR